MHDIDDLDLQILARLYADCAVTNKELAANLGIPPSTCLERVRRLRAQKSLKGCHARVDVSALGVNLQALTMVRLDKHSRELSDAFRDDLLGLPEVSALYHLGGVFDFAIHVCVRDSDHLRDFVFSALTSRPEVAQIQTSVVYEYAQSPSLPIVPDINE